MRAAIAVLAPAALILAPSPARGFGQPRAKVNLVDIERAPELTLFMTYLDAKDRPVPASKLEGVEVWMNSRKVADDAETLSLKTSEHRVAIALVLCGYAGCVGKGGTAQKAAIGEVAGPGRPGDFGTVIVYENNIRNLSKGKFVPLAEAGPLAAKARLSSTAYRSKMMGALKEALALFQSNDKLLPPQRAIVMMSDGLDGQSRTATGTEAKVMQVISSARAAGVRIYTVGHATDTDVGLDNLKILSRKTGGTYRRAFKAKEIPILFKEVAAEIFGQTVIDFVPKLRKGQQARFYVAFQHKGKRILTSREVPYEVRIKEVHFRWRHWGMIALIVLGVLLLIALIAVVVIIIRRRRKKKRDIERSLAQADADEVLDEEEKAAAKAEEAAAAKGKKGKVAKKKKSAKEAAEDGPPRKICPRCERVMLDDWEECLFCKAGIEKDVSGG